MKFWIVVFLLSRGIGSTDDIASNFTTQLRPDLYLSACAFEYYLGYHQDFIENNKSAFGAGGNIGEINIFFSRSRFGVGGRLVEATTSNTLFKNGFPYYFYLAALAPHITYTTRYAENGFDLLTVSGCYVIDMYSIAIEYRRVVFVDHIPSLFNTELKIRAAFFSYSDVGMNDMKGMTLGVGIKIGFGYWDLTRIPVRKEKP